MTVNGCIGYSFIPYINFDSSTNTVNFAGYSSVCVREYGWIMIDKAVKFQSMWDASWTITIDDEVLRSGNGPNVQEFKFTGEPSKWYSLYIYYDSSSENNQNFTLSWNNTSDSSFSPVPMTSIYLTELITYPTNPYNITVVDSICGDGFWTGSEEWDDGNLNETDGWFQDWTVADGWIWAGKSNDTKNTCSEICGDGKRFNTLDTYWDDHNTDNSDGCSSACEVETGWNWTGGSSTSKDTWKEIWGDGVKFNSNKTYWDDGNKVSNDGCNSTWSVEDSWNCTGGSNASRDVCKDIWGDGIRFDTNSTYWDDNNTLSGDGWSKLWVVESGWKWSGGSFNHKDECEQTIDQGMIIYLLTIWVVFLIQFSLR